MFRREARIDVNGNRLPINGISLITNVDNEADLTVSLSSVTSYPLTWQPINRRLADRGAASAPMCIDVDRFTGFKGTL
jgi:hypothetical protein